MESDRTAVTPAAPLTARSTGRVTSCSTCSDASPGASVCTMAWAGTKSGNTSYLAWASTTKP